MLVATVAELKVTKRIKSFLFANIKFITHFKLTDYFSILMEKNLHDKEKKKRNEIRLKLSLPYFVKGKYYTHLTNLFKILQYLQ